MNEQEHTFTIARTRLLGTSLGLALLLLVGLVGGLLAAEREGSLNAEAAQAGLMLAKSIDDDTPAPGDTLDYTLVLSNDTGTAVNGVVLTDALPAELNYISGTVWFDSDQAIFNPPMVMSDTIVISGNMGINGWLEVTFQTLLSDTVADGTEITNTAVVTGAGALVTADSLLTVQTIQPEFTLTKSVDDDAPAAGDTLNYTVDLSNDTGEAVSGVILTDVLPAELTYVPGTLNLLAVQAIFNPLVEVSDTLVISGNMAENGSLEMTFQALLTDTIAEGEMVTNTAVVAAEGTSVTADAALTVAPAVREIYMPLISKPFPAPTLQTTQPGTNNQWTLSWNDVSDDETGYRLEEATDPDFTVNRQVYDLGVNVTSRQIQKAIDDTNTYYYRVRALGEQTDGPWSNVVNVVTIPELTIEANTPDFDNDWTVSWEGGNPNISHYELQESHQADFSSGVSTYNTGTDTSRKFTHSAGIDNVYHYRVRAVVDGVPGDWSNTAKVVGAYFADFDNEDSDWAVRRASTENWNVFYRDSNDHLQAEVDGTREYIIVSPLRPAPALEYELEMAAKFKDVEDRDTYSIIFNGEWDGGACPEANFTGCFDQYYWFRVQYRTNNGDPYLEFKLQRVTGHTSGNDPIAKELIDWTEVSSAEPDDWNEWQVKLEKDGDIKIYLDGIRVGSVRDDHFLDNPEKYWGLGVQTKDESDATVRFDFYGVSRSDR